MLVFETKPTIQPSAENIQPSAENISCVHVLDFCIRCHTQMSFLNIFAIIANRLLDYYDRLSPKQRHFIRITQFKSYGRGGSVVETETSKRVKFQRRREFCAHSTIQEHKIRDLKCSKTNIISEKLYRCELHRSNDPSSPN